MNYKKKNIEKISEEDLLILIKYIYQKKIIIFFSIVILTIGGYFYGTIQKKYYISIVKIKDIPNVYLDKYLHFILSVPNNNAAENKFLLHNYNKVFNLNLLSHDNFIEFLDSYKDIDSYKADLKKKNINLKKFFKNKFKEVNWDDNIKYPRYYSFTFDKLLPGDQVLNDYVIFTKRQTNEQYKKEITLLLKNKIDYFSRNLDLAKKIQLKDPIYFKPEQLKKQNFPLVVEPNSLFYKGSNILSLEVDYLKNQIEQMSENFDLEKYDPFQEKASSPELVSISNLQYAIFGSILGLILSIILIFCNFLIKNTIK